MRSRNCIHAYPNPHTDKDSADAGFHGGQSDPTYHGGDNPNATATPLNAGEDGSGDD